MNSRLQWFLDRIGKEVYGVTTEPLPKGFKNYEARIGEGVFLHSRHQCLIIFATSESYKIKYFDTKEEAEQYKQPL